MRRRWVLMRHRDKRTPGAPDAAVGPYLKPGEVVHVVEEPIVAGERTPHRPAGLVARWREARRRLRA